MKKEYLVLTIILAISLIVTLVLLIGTPSFTCKAEGKCLDPMGLCWILAEFLVMRVNFCRLCPARNRAACRFDLIGRMC